MSFFYLISLRLITLLPGLIRRLPLLFQAEKKEVDSYTQGTIWLKYLHAGTVPLLGLIDAVILAAGNSHVRHKLFFCVTCRQNEMTERVRNFSLFWTISFSCFDRPLTHLLLF